MRRTMCLAMLFLTTILYRHASAEQFSIECQWIQSYFVSFDTDTKRVVHESIAGTALKGRISVATAEEIRFTLLRVGTPPFELIWRPSGGKLTWLDLPGDPTRRGAESICRRTALRSILFEYEGIAPYD